MPVHFITLVNGQLEQQPDDEDLQLRGPIDLDDQYITSRSGPLMLVSAENPGAANAVWPIQVTTDGDTRGYWSNDFQHRRASSDQVAAGQGSVICGGADNKTEALSFRSAIVGGWRNLAAGYYCFVGAGYLNEANATYSVIGSGYDNEINGVYGVILSGLRNTIEQTAPYSAIVMGNQNLIESQNSFIGAGYQNKIENTSGFGIYNVVVGGWQNEMDACRYCFTGGGYQNHIALTHYSVICGGDSNDIEGGYHAFIGGGDSNSVSGNAASVVGGLQNDAQGNYSVVAGGRDNTVGGYASAIIAGEENIAKHDYAVASGKLSEATLYGEHAQASGAIGNEQGGNQTSVVVARGTTTDNTFTKLTLNDAGNQHIFVDPNSMITLFILVNGCHRSGSKGAGWLLAQSYRRDGSGNIQQLLPALKVNLGNEGTYDVIMAIENTGAKHVYISVKGATGETVYWTARVEIVKTKVDGLIAFEAEPIRL